jgi:hypothetical protein
MKIFGIDIERKTDIIALTGFVLALAATLHQFSGYLRGPVVKVFPPEQVVIYAQKFGAANTEYVRFTAAMTYVNSGQPGYNAAVKNEAIRYNLTGKWYEQKWQELGSSGSKDNVLLWEKSGDAHPFSIDAGSAESHETAFAPRNVRVGEREDPTTRSRNYLKWDDFTAGVSGLKEFEFTFVSDIYGQTPVRTKCTVYLTNTLISTLKTRKWISPSCWAEQAD